MATRIKQLIHAEDEALDVYQAFVLLWVAAPGGKLDRQALNHLYQHHQYLPSALDRADKLLNIIADDDLGSFLLACRELQHRLRREEASTLLRNAIATATAGGRLTTAANHTLRFLADLFSCDLTVAYREQAGRELPPPGNPGSLDWWRQQEVADQRNTGAPELSGTLPVTRSEALAVLGLVHDVSDMAVKQAYRRLVQKHHPDRVARLDSCCHEAAMNRFLQIQRAYELLRR